MSYNPVSIDEYQRLLAENERLRADVELHKELLADEREELRHAVDTENRLTARVRALEGALRDAVMNLEPAEEGALVRVNTKNACPSDVAVVGTLYALRDAALTGPPPPAGGQG